MQDIDGDGNPDDKEDFYKLTCIDRTADVFAKFDFVFFRRHSRYSDFSSLFFYWKNRRSIPWAVN
ncbi:hypothetical protein EfmJHP9_27840 [Enterococcus faecium]|nr:hypothetical protein EfmJHP9_27840 [Enterococcus faecium]